MIHKPMGHGKIWYRHAKTYIKCTSLSKAQESIYTGNSPWKTCLETYLHAAHITVRSTWLVEVQLVGHLLRHELGVLVVED